MAEHLIIKGETKEELYTTLLPQLKSLVEGESDIIANMANISACIMDTFHFWWVGFYRVIDGTLVLGPFQGPLACTRIKRGKGVCGTAWDKAETIVVEDVEKFPGHIACSSASRSEIVVPVIRNGEVIAVLDIDSEHLSTFDDIDKNVADVQHGTSAHMNFQGKHLIYTPEIVAIAKQIGSRTKVDAEIRHGELATCRKSQSRLT